MRTRVAFAIATCLSMSAAHAVAQSPPPDVRRFRSFADALRYQGSGPEQTEQFSRKVRIGRDGRFSITNVSGDITISGGSGEDVSIEAVKRTRGNQSRLAEAHIIIDDRPGRVDVRSEYEGTTRNTLVRIDYTVTVPSSASVDAKSVLGNVKVSGVRGTVRAESVAGNVTTASTPRIELAKSVSGNVDLSDVSTNGDLTAGSVSGSIRAKGLKSRGLDLNSVSGDVMLSDVSCERLDAKSVAGNVEYSGALARGGRYGVSSHSGTVRFVLSGNTGFELDASSFSGLARSELPLTIGGNRTLSGDTVIRRRGFGPGRGRIQATFGDGSATVNIRTFSGDIVITKGP